MKEIRIFIIMLFWATFCKAQDNNEIIKSSIADYLIEKEDINTIDEFDRRVFIVEIKENKVLGYNNVGIFRVGTFGSSSDTYILLKGGEDFEIIDSYYFSENLGKITSFLVENKFSNDDIIVYLEKIVELYKNNHFNAQLKW